MYNMRCLLKGPYIKLMLFMLLAHVWEHSPEQGGLSVETKTPVVDLSAQSCTELIERQVPREDFPPTVVCYLLLQSDLTSCFFVYLPPQ